MDRMAYRKGLARRMKAAREGAGRTQGFMARYLGMEEDTYRKQENAGALPPELFEPFAEATGVDLLYLLTGRHQDQPPIRRIG